MPSLGNLPDSGIEPTSPVSPALEADFLPAEPLGKPKRQMRYQGKMFAVYVTVEEVISFLLTVFSNRLEGEYPSR